MPWRYEGWSLPTVLAEGDEGGVEGTRVLKGEAEGRGSSYTSIDVLAPLHKGPQLCWEN
jgi:hypothetical protein